MDKVKKVVMYYSHNKWNCSVPVEEEHIPGMEAMYEKHGYPHFTCDEDIVDVAGNPDFTSVRYEEHQAYIWKGLTRLAQNAVTEYIQDCPTAEAYEKVKQALLRLHSEYIEVNDPTYERHPDLNQDELASLRAENELNKDTIQEISKAGYDLVEFLEHNYTELSLDRNSYQIFDDNELERAVIEFNDKLPPKDILEP